MLVSTGVVAEYIIGALPQCCMPVLLPLTIAELDGCTVTWPPTFPLSLRQSCIVP